MSSMSNRPLDDEKAIIKAQETILDYQAGKEIDESALRTAIVTLREKLLQYFAGIRVDLYINHLKNYSNRKSYQDILNSLAELDKPIDNIRRTLDLFLVILDVTSLTHETKRGLITSLLTENTLLFAFLLI